MCEPLVVAAYTDEMCAVALLRFPRWLCTERGLEVGARLLTANTYVRGSRRALVALACSVPVGEVG